MSITQIKSCRIDERMPTLFRPHFKSPKRRFCESVFDRAPLISVVAVGAKRIVRCDQQNARPGALKANNVALAKLTSIQTDVIRSNAGGQRFNVKKFGIPLVDLEPDFSRLRVPVERKVTGKLLHAGDFFGDRGCFRVRGRARLCRNAGSKKQENGKREDETLHSLFPPGGQVMSADYADTTD